ncbi:MAG: hypothetical protein VKK32_07290 [Candidatus Melainabacteria bacterium]|nr:hypothetical protein [Candidatus Melainabacteria bacterium]
MTETQLIGKLVPVIKNEEFGEAGLKGSELKIYRLKKKFSEQHKLIIEAWDTAMRGAASCYGRTVGPNTRRIYFNSAVKFFKYLKDDYSNLYQACVMAIDSCPSHAYSSKKHVKESAISLSKFLIYKGELLNE